MFGLSDIEVIRTASPRSSTKSDLSPSLSPAKASLPNSDFTECNLDQTYMRWEDLRAAYARLEERSRREIAELTDKCAKASSQVKLTRERSSLKQKMEKFENISRESVESGQLRKSFEEIAISYWLLTKDGEQVNSHLQTYVRSLLQGNEDSEGPQEAGDFRKLMASVAHLKREVTEKDLAITMCVVHLNKLSTAVSTLAGQELPLIQKYPELELPELCKALSRLISRQIARPPLDSEVGPRTYFDTGKYIRERKQGLTRVSDSSETPKDKEVEGRELELRLEEIMFDRDLMKKQNSILRQCTGEKLPERERLALFEQLSAKEESVRIQLDIVAEERGHLAKERADFRTKNALKSEEMAKLEAMNERLTKLLMVKKVEAGTSTEASYQSQATNTATLPTLTEQESSTDPVVLLNQAVSTVGLVRMVEKACDPVIPTTLSKKVGVDPGAFSSSKYTNTDKALERSANPTSQAPAKDQTLPPKTPAPALSTEPSRPPRYRDSTQRKAISTRNIVAQQAEAMASAVKVFESAQKNIGMIERHWSHINTRKLQESIKDRKNCITPLRGLQSALMRRKGTMSPFTDFDAEEMEEMRQDGARSCIAYAEDLSDLSFGSLAGGISALDLRDDPQSHYASGQMTPSQLQDPYFDPKHTDLSFKSDCKTPTDPITPRKPQKSVLKRSPQGFRS